MSKKSLSFDEIDEELLEGVRGMLKRECRTDMDIIRHLMSSFVDNRHIQPARDDDDDAPKKKKKLTEDQQEIMKELIEDIDRRYEEDALCPIHPNKAVSQCGVKEDNHILEELLRRSGIVL